MDTLYFAYGSNLDPDGMRYRCPGSVPYDVATLHGWRLTFRGVADVETPGGHVLGVVWLCPPEDMAALDRYEGVGGGFYERVTLPVELDCGVTVQAVVYVMCQPHSRYDNASLPTQGYLDSIARGYRYFDLPVDALRDALAHAQARVGRKGVTQVRSDGAKRMRPVGWENPRTRTTVPSHPTGPVQTSSRTRSGKRRSKKSRARSRRATAPLKVGGRIRRMFETGDLPSAEERATLGITDATWDELVMAAYEDGLLTDQDMAVL